MESQCPPRLRNQCGHHDSVIIGDYLYRWNLWTQKLETFNLPSGKWQIRNTTGLVPSDPAAGHGYCCAAVEEKIYYFGGRSIDETRHSNSIHELDTANNFRWSVVEDNKPGSKVMQRGYGGMVALELDGQPHLLMIGGIGSRATDDTIRDDAFQYTGAEHNRERTNQQNVYDLTNRCWLTVRVTGCTPPPFSGFVFHKMSDTTVLLYGGVEDKPDQAVKAIRDIYVVTARKKINNEIELNWQKISGHTASKWPVARYCHASGFIGGPSATVVMFGGLNDQRTTQTDCWLLNTTPQYTWTELQLRTNVAERFGHAVSVFAMGPNRVWLLVGGGLICCSTSEMMVDNKDFTMIIELIYIDGQWSLGHVMDSNEIGHAIDYIQKFIGSLKEGRKELQRQTLSRSFQNAQGQRALTGAEEFHTPPIIGPIEAPPIEDKPSPPVAPRVNRAK